MVNYENCIMCCGVFLGTLMLSIYRFYVLWTTFSPTTRHINNFGILFYSRQVIRTYFLISKSLEAGLRHKFGPESGSSNCPEFL